MTEIANKIIAKALENCEDFPEVEHLNNIVLLTAIYCMELAEQQRLKILKNKDDPSWTEHLAEVQTNIATTFGVTE